MSAIQTMASNFKEETAKYVEQLYPMIVKVLETDSLVYSASPETEADHSFDPNQQHMHT